jgi:lipopolysaccharide transport system ATP-binding protein
MAGSSDLLISVENVSVSYTWRGGLLKRKEHWALKDVSFKIYRGETLGIIGRNGCGKSTLMRTLAGIISPDGGQINKNGDVTASLLALGTGFNPHISGEDNVILSGMLLGRTRREMLDRMESIFDFAELGQFRYEPVATYSSGMKARLGFSTAFVVNPDVLLIDEVFGVGDAVFKEKSMEAMENTVRSNHTIVIVSHQASLMERVCHRAVWIEKGRVAAVGPAPVVMWQYQNNQPWPEDMVMPEQLHLLP